MNLKTKERLTVPFSFVKAAKNPKITRYSTLSDFIVTLYSPTIKGLANAQELRKLRQTNKLEYDIKKNQLEGFIIGEFSERKDSACKTYVPLLAFDIDGIDGSFFTSVRLNSLRENPYVFLAFPSPSGCGLRVLIWTNATQKTHKYCYAQVATCLADFLGIKTDKQLNIELSKQGLSKAKIRAKIKETEHLDTSTSNISRHWYFTAILEGSIHYNKDSLVYEVKPLEPTKTANQLPIVNSNNSALQNKNSVTEIPNSTVNGNPKMDTKAKELTDNQRITLIDAIVKARHKSGRNMELFDLACLLYEYPIDKNTIQSYCSKYIEYSDNPFTEAEFNKTIKSAYRTVNEKGNIGRYSDNQLFAYGNKVLGWRKVNSLLGIDDQLVADNSNQDSNETTDFDTYLEDIERLTNVKKYLREKYERDADYKFPKSMLIREYLLGKKGKYDFRRNMIALDVEYKSKKATTYRVLNDYDISNELLDIGLTGIEKPLIGLLKSSRIPEYNPVQRYFRSLPKWNGKTDYIEQLASYIKAKDQQWFNYQFKKWLVRAAACGLNIIPFNKQCFTLQSSQNDGKSYFLRFLCPPKLKKYITENPTFDDKDGRLTLAQNYIINLDELAKLPRRDINRIKSFFTKDTIKDRLPYDRTPTTLQRIANFVGSTNDAEFLTDETGNVRWLIFPINDIQHDNGGANGYNKNVDIDKVYGQAHTLLQSGFDFQMSKSDIQYSEKINRQFMINTVEIELISQNYQPATKRDSNAEFLTATDILDELTRDRKYRIKRVNIGKALKILGFKQSQKYSKTKKYQIKGYFLTRI